MPPDSPPRNYVLTELRALAELAGRTELREFADQWIEDARAAQTRADSGEPPEAAWLTARYLCLHPPAGARRSATVCVAPSGLAHLFGSDPVDAPPSYLAVWEPGGLAERAAAAVARPEVLARVVDLLSHALEQRGAERNLSQARRIKTTLRQFIAFVKQRALELAALELDRAEDTRRAAERAAAAADEDARAAVKTAMAAADAMKHAEATVDDAVASFRAMALRFIRLPRPRYAGSSQKRPDDDDT